MRFLLLEKGIELATEEIDILSGENRQATYVAKNPSGELPSLELDDSTVLAETVAICEYLEELKPEPVLVGATAAERASTRIWTRRVELGFSAPMIDAFRSAEGAAMFKDRRHLIPQAADDWKQIAQEELASLHPIATAGGMRA